MKKAWVLSKLYINTLYGTSGFLYDLKNNRKNALKMIGFIALIALSMSGTVAMFVGLNAKLYDILKPANQQGMVITLMVVMASLMTFVFGLMGIIATYFVDKEGDILLSMPIKGWQILVAKIASNYVYEALLSLFIMGTGFVVYGIKSGTSPLLYVVGVVIALLVPVIPMTIGYFLVIPMMRAGKLLRNKDANMILSGLVVMVFVFGIQYLSQTMVNLQTNPAKLAEMVASENGLVSIAGRVYFPSIWATYAIIDVLTVKGIVNLVTFAGISIGVVSVLVLGMSGIYAKSIEGSQEVTKKKKFTTGEFKQNLKGKSSFSSLLSREIRMMNREPVYFLNGPLIVLLLPVIFGVMALMDRENSAKQLQMLMAMPNAEYFSTMIVAGLSIFLAVSVNITPTCISREGKAFEVVKAMPVKANEYLLAKLAHGMIFGILSSIMCGALGFFILKLPFMNLLVAFVIALSAMLPILIAGILMDITWPKLIWDNPQKAMKQNLNGVVIILGSMFLLGLLGLAIYNLVNVPAYGYAGAIVVPGILAIVLYRILMSYGVKQFYSIEV